MAIGITADSFIVYFERIRDELREGRTLPAAVERGWDRARRTILASDAVNLLAAVVLYLLAVGGVKGFAFTLGLTTVLDLFVVFMFTRGRWRPCWPGPSSSAEGTRAVRSGPWAARRPGAVAGRVGAGPVGGEGERRGGGATQPAAPSDRRAAGVRARGGGQGRHDGGRRGSAGGALYRGEVSYNFVGRRRMWSAECPAAGVLPSRRTGGRDWPLDSHSGARTLSVIEFEGGVESADSAMCPVARSSAGRSNQGTRSEGEHRAGWPLASGRWRRRHGSGS